MVYHYSIDNDDIWVDKEHKMKYDEYWNTI